VGDVGEDEAVAVNLFDLAAQRERELIGVDRLEPPSLEISRALKPTRRTISRSGSWRQPAGV
jgi:hypothetical protein